MSFDEADYQAERASVTEVLWSLVDSPWDLGSTLQVILDNAVRLARSAQDAHRFGQHLSNPEVGSIGLHRPQQEGNIARGRGLADLGEQSKIALYRVGGQFKRLLHQLIDLAHLAILASTRPTSQIKQIESNNEYRSSGCTELIGKYRVDGPLRPGVTRVAKGVAVPDVTRPHEATRASKLLRQGLTKRHQRVPGGQLGRNC